MRARAVTIALLVVAAFAVIGPIAFAGDAGDATAGQPGNDSEMGHQVSSFMQSSAGQTGQSVESGMWDAAFDNAAEKAQADVVEQRIENLRDRLDSLEQRKRTLQEARENGSIEERTYRARMSRLVGEMAALNRSIDRVEEDAKAVGLDTAPVEDLRDRAGGIVDAEMAAVAADMAGGPPAEAPGGGNSGPPAEDCSPDDEDCPDDEPPDDGPPDDGPPDDDEPPEDGPPDDDSSGGKAITP